MMDTLNNLNDNKIRLIFIPAFGLIIPNTAGLLLNNQYSVIELTGAYLFFIFISYSIWQGNRFLLFKLRERFSWLNSPVKKIVMLLLANIFYTVPLTVLSLLFWYGISKSPAVDWNAIFMATLMCVICVMFITHVYETVFLVKQWEADTLNKEKLERAKTNAELESLKNQIDPHFIFNSLNTLSHLIESDSEKAKIFSETLADIYRYILMNKERNLVLLKDEIEFLNNYFMLIKIRFGSSINLVIDVDDSLQNNYLIPPISLQLLMENVIKHNEFSESNPICVNFSFSSGSILVSNDYRVKKSIVPSSKLGLSNLKERFTLTTGKNITIQNSGNTFDVILPLLKA